MYSFENDQITSLYLSNEFTNETKSFNINETAILPSLEIELLSGSTSVQDLKNRGIDIFRDDSIAIDTGKIKKYIRPIVLTAEQTD